MGVGDAAQVPVQDAGAELADPELAEAGEDLAVEPVAIRLRSDAGESLQMAVPELGEHGDTAVRGDLFTGLAR